MGQVVKELLYDAIAYDEPYLAHAIYYAVQKGIVKLEDPASTIPYEQLDYEVILKMRDENQLMMCGIKLVYHSDARQTIRALSRGKRRRSTRGASSDSRCTSAYNHRCQ